MNKAFLLPAIAAGFAAILSASSASAETVYVSNNGGNTIAIINGNTTTTIGSSAFLAGPTGLAFNSAGDLFIANNATPNNGYIEKYDPTAGTFTTFATGLENPRGIAFDSQGNLYVANQSGGTITKITSGGIESTYAAGLNTPNGIVFDTQGNLYVALGSNANQIARIDTGGIVSTFSTTGAQLNQLNGITFGPDGNLYVVNQGGPSIEKITTNLVGSLFVSGGASGLNGPKSLGFDDQGNLYVTDEVANEVTEYNSLGQLIHTFTSDLNLPCYLTFGPSSLPIPEPSTYALLLAGMVGVYYYNRRRTAVPVKI